MSRKKTCPIGEAIRVVLSPSAQDKRALAYFEHRLMTLNKKNDCLEVSDADVIRYALNLAYDTEHK